MAVRHDRGAVLRERRQPTTDERKAVSALTQALRSIRKPMMDTHTAPSSLPGGRFDTQQAVLLTKQVFGQEVITAKPFERQHRTMRPDPPMRVGIMCDISGSMTSAMEPLAVARWAIASAVHAVGGQVATVLFGDNAHGIQRGRQRQSDIEVYEATGGWENYDPAFSMIDGELDLIDGEGPRLLIIITDGRFNDHGAVRWAEVTMDMARKSGLAVVWVVVSGRFQRADGYGYGEDSVLDATGMTPVEMAQALGRRVVEVFKASR